MFRGSRGEEEDGEGRGERGGVGARWEVLRWSWEEGQKKVGRRRREVECMQD